MCWEKTPSRGNRMGTEPKKPRKPLEKPLETRYGRPYSYRPEELTTLSPRSSVTHLISSLLPLVFHSHRSLCSLNLRFTNERRAKRGVNEVREGWKGAEKERGIMMLLPVISVLCSWVPILSSPFSPLSLHSPPYGRRTQDEETE